MEIPIQVATRVFPFNEDEANSSSSCVQTIPISPNSMVGGIVQVCGQNSFQVTHALGQCTQSELYFQTIYPLISLFLEGFDASVVTYGQRCMGKTYSLIGPGFDCICSEEEQGVIQRCVRDIFGQLNAHPERSVMINIGWVEIIGDDVRNLFESGSVMCRSISDVFHWMQIGISNKSDSPTSHSLFTITLEQQWITDDGLIQHRLSTASFCDLCGTERMFMPNDLDQNQSVPKDLGLQALEQIVTMLIDPMVYNLAAIPYNSTTLTTLLKDSFGGRAQTLLILCVSPFERDVNETIFNLQFAFKAQCVRNYVIMNTFSDNNTPLSPEVVNPPQSDDTFGLQFAASQWAKLVSNAEGLFAKLLGNKSITELDREQIEEWLFLKQECEDCLSSNDGGLSQQKQLGPIQEAEEPDEATSNADETSVPQNSDNESDIESQRPDFEEKIGNILYELKLKTDNLVNDKYEEFIKTQPKPVMESTESFRPVDDDRRSSNGGRRRSIQPGISLSSADIALLNRVANQKVAIGLDSSKSTLDFLESSSEHNRLRKHISPIDKLQKKIRECDADIEAKATQIKELEQTLALKLELETNLIKNKETRSSAKQRFHKKRNKLKAQYEETKKMLKKAEESRNRDKAEIERLKTLTIQTKQKLDDVESMRDIAVESGQKLNKVQESVYKTKKQLKELQKSLKKDQKSREHIENEIKSLKDKEQSGTINEKNKKLIVQDRISQLDNVLKTKSQNLEQGINKNSQEQESLRHEIRNLRRTRDLLLDQRCALDRKLKKEKILSHREERKLLECDEAIEAIDAAIEFKNELICGRKSIDTNERSHREKGEQMLIARLNKLSLEEMRTMLYKYFTKVIDLRDSSRKLDLQLMTLERERDAYEWRERILMSDIQQTRLEGERKLILLQKQHETKLTLMLRHLAEETSASSSSFGTPWSTPTPNQQFLDSDFEIDIYNPSVIAAQKQYIKTKSDLCPMPDALSKYKPLDKIKEKDRESKNKLFAKFQVLTRYHGVSGNEKKKQSQDLSIPEENLKQLIAATPATKVTRQKNKIIIQNSSKKTH